MRARTGRTRLFRILVGSGCVLTLYTISCALWFCGNRDLREVSVLIGGRDRQSLAASTLPASSGVTNSIKILSYNLNHVSRGNDNIPQNDPYFPAGVPEWKKIGMSLRASFRDPGKMDRNMEAILGVIKQEAPDIVFLQEVDRDVLESFRIDTATAIAQRAGYQYAVWGPKWSMDLGIRHITGNAILSKYPIVEVENIPLNSIDGWHAYRKLVGVHTALVATLDMGPGNEKIKVINTHLYSKKFGYDKKKEQVDKLLEMVAASPYPIVVGGDFNCSYYRLQSNKPSSNDPTLPRLFFSGLLNEGGFFDEKSLDYLFLRKGDPTHYQQMYKLPPVATDHNIIVSVVGIERRGNKENKAAPAKAALVQTHFLPLALILDAK